MTLRRLLELKPDKKLKDKAGQMAVEVARQAERADLVELLKD